MNKKHIGSSMDEFLIEEDLLEAVEAIAIKRVIAYELEQARKKQKITKNKLAELMQTSRAALDRLLDPNNPATTLKSIIRATQVLGLKMSVAIQ